ncbi:Set1/Ash2 histone methyltransferase complex subunit ASH2 [Blattella germanica]|nr:Set1/Ash2 histone methyltransferase complex subunit ASH2 [Blattella germanica]
MADSDTSRNDPEETSRPDESSSKTNDQEESQSQKLESKFADTPAESSKSGVSDDKKQMVNISSNSSNGSSSNGNNNNTNNSNNNGAGGNSNNGATKPVQVEREGNCYCGKDRNLNIVELLCANCLRWYHESCIGYQLGKLVPFMMNYFFVCKNCSPTGLESFKKNQAAFPQMCVTAIGNLMQASVKEGSPRTMFSKDRDIIPFIDSHWEGMTTMPRRVTQSWHSTIHRALSKDVGTLFVCEDGSGDNLFGLVAPDLTHIKPNYEAMIRGGHLKVTDMGIQHERHPFIIGSFEMYFTFQEFDESSDWAGKPIPGWLYRTLSPSSVLLALHDRAPQLRISEDRLAVTGDKGYCMIRATHAVSRGSWYWEATVEEMPEGSATRLGWAQEYANLQAPLGYDKFGYSWRSRKGSRFHECRGKHYSSGYGEGDTLGFLIILPESHTVNYIPHTYKDRPLVKFKSHLYYEEKDRVAEGLKALKVLKGSQLIFFKNGVCQGVAFTDIYGGHYYPTLSLHKTATVSVNFGPNFKYAPQEKPFRGMYEKAEEAICEQTMADLLYLTENEGKLRLDTYCM